MKINSEYIFLKFKYMSDLDSKVRDDIDQFGFRLAHANGADVDDSSVRDSYPNRFLRIAQGMPMQWSMETLTRMQHDIFWYLSWEVVGPIRKDPMDVVQILHRQAITWTFPIYNNDGVTKRVQRLTTVVLAGVVTH